MEEIKALFINHSDIILRYFQRVTYDLETASDLLQDTFVKAARYYDKTRIKRPRTWLFQIAYSVFKDYLKSSVYTETLDYDTIDKRINVHDHVYWHSLNMRIIDKLKYYDLKFAHIYTLRMLGLKNREIAKIGSVSVRTLTRRLREVKKIIMDNFGEELSSLGVRR